MFPTVQNTSQVYCNPSYLNTKKLSKERLLFLWLGKLIGLHPEAEESINQDFESLRVNQIRALMSVAGCMGSSISLKKAAQPWQVAAF